MTKIKILWDVTLCH